MKFITKFAALACCALTLAGCIYSTKPILSDPQPLLGQRLQLQLYTLRGGFAHEPEGATFVWNGKVYAFVGGNAKGMNDFTLHPFEGGDYIAQSVPAGDKKNFEYALVRKLSDGVYHVVAVDEEDADAAARTANCVEADKYSCAIKTREALMLFARATAAKKKDDGGLAIRLADEPKRKR